MNISLQENYDLSKNLKKKFKYQINKKKIQKKNMYGTERENFSIKTDRI